MTEILQSKSSPVIKARKLFYPLSVLLTLVACGDAGSVQNIKNQPVPIVENIPAPVDFLKFGNGVEIAEFENIFGQEIGSGEYSFIVIDDPSLSCLVSPYIDDNKTLEVLSPILEKSTKKALIIVASTDWCSVCPKFESYLKENWANYPFLKENTMLLLLKLQDNDYLHKCDDRLYAYPWVSVVGNDGQIVNLFGEQTLDTVQNVVMNGRSSLLNP